ncbi:MAG: ABC transporter substrate-binding protein [Candidatus Competibacteraceae bacterium]
MRAQDRAARTARGLRRVTAAYDLDSRAYTEGWLDDFRAAFAEGGGEIVQMIGFESGGDRRSCASPRLARASQPDGVVIVANSVDTAMFCQQIRKLDARIPLIGSEWGATERLTELGGKAVEGLTVAQIFDRDNAAPRYRTFSPTLPRSLSPGAGFRRRGRRSMPPTPCWMRWPSSPPGAISRKPSWTCAASRVSSNRSSSTSLAKPNGTLSSRWCAPASSW